MKLYTGPFSVFGGKVQIAVAEKRIDCEVEFVPFNFTDRYSPKHPEILRINPKTQVPVLVDGDVEIYDSTQIFEYVEHRHPEPALWPETPVKRAEARLLEHAADEVYFPHVMTLIQNYASLGSEDAETARRGAAAYYDQMDELLADREYLAGDYSYADIALIMAHYFGVFLTADIKPGHKNVDAWRQRVLARPAVRSVIEPVNEYTRAAGLTPPAFADKT